MEKLELPAGFLESIEGLNTEELKERLDYLRGQDTKLQATCTEACKGLTLLNSGAVAAMLAMIQALIARGTFSSFKNYSLIALTIFLLGATIASTVFFFLVHRISGSMTENRSVNNTVRNMLRALIWSMACFILGSTTVVIGLALSF